MNPLSDILPVFLRRLGVSLVLVALVALGLLLSRGEAPLLFALLLGFAAALIFVWNMAFRLKSLMRLRGKGQAQRQMLWGMVLRLLVLALVLLVAAKISSQVFALAAIGFVTCYALALLHLILLNTGKNKK